jgi:multiple sugar transport system substrate-binding protein
MKRLLVCVLAALMILGIAGCGAKPASDGSASVSGASGTGDSIVLTFWAHQEAWNDSYKKIADQYMTEHPNIKIQLEFFPYDEYEAKLQTSLIAKTSDVDIYELWGGWAIDFASTGALAEIPESMEKGIREDSYPSTIGSLEYDGKLYGLPMEFNIECGGMFVNKKLLEQDGLTIPTTWDELMKEAKEATKMDGDEFAVKGFDFVNWDGVTYLMTSMILSKGGQYLNDDGTFNFTSEQAKEAFTTLVDLVTKDKVTDMIGLTGGGTLEGYQQLYADKALFVPRGPWPIAEGETTFGLKYDTDFTYAAMPWYGDKVAFAAETGWALAVNGSSEKKDAAFEFLNYFYSDDVLMQHNIYCSMIPPKKSVANDPEVLEAMPFMKPLVGILDKAQYIGYFNTDVFKETINNVFVDYCTGLYPSVDDALKKLESDLNEKLS